MAKENFGVVEPSKLAYWTPSEQAKALYCYLLCAGHYFCEPSYYVGRVRFDSYLLVVVKEGELLYLLNDKVASVQAGCAAIIDCHKPHTYYTVKKTEFYFTHFDGSYVQKLIAPIVSDARHMIPLEQDSIIEAYLTHMLYMLENRGIFKEEKASVMLYSILMELIAHAHGESGAKKVHSPVQNALDFITTHYQEAIAVADLAKMCGFSLYHFSRVFKDEVGCSPYQYLVNSRLDRARYLLITTNWTVREIAFTVGYNSEANFAFAFASREGVSPGKFRKSYHGL